MRARTERGIFKEILSYPPQQLTSIFSVSDEGSFFRFTEKGKPTHFVTVDKGPKGDSKSLKAPQNRIPGPHCGTVCEAVIAPLYPAILSNRVSSARICTKYTPAVSFGILAGSGGDILFPQTEVPFFYPYGVSPLVQHGASLL